MNRKAKFHLSSFLILFVCSCGFMAGCGFQEETGFVRNVQLPSDPTWWNTDWSNRRRLTFDNSAQAENLVLFPVLVRLDGTRIDYAKTRDGGQDIRFVDSDLTALSFEIELWNEEGESFVWVEIPQIDGGSNEDFIWIYYGNQSAPDGQDPAGVWDNGFLGVWHLNDSIDPVTDSTSAGNHCTNNGAAYTPSGALDGAFSFNGNGDAVEASSHTYVFSEEMTLEAWFRYSGPGTGSPRILEISKTGNADSHCLAPDSDGSLRAWAESATGSRVAAVDDPADYDDGAWHYMVYTYENPDGILYVDGNVTDTASGSSSDLDDCQYFIIGAVSDASTQYAHSDHEFDGLVDEVRVSDTARTADWLNAQFLSMNDGFVVYGTEE
ncbi:MAG: DUF2341 domain-containing protein [Spirochaetes bacterium]|nr:DUF2341 domain-containing protein [Spirochaetota bacterium]